MTDLTLDSCLLLVSATRSSAPIRLPHLTHLTIINITVPKSFGDMETDTLQLLNSASLPALTHLTIHGGHALWARCNFPLTSRALRSLGLQLTHLAHDCTNYLSLEDKSQEWEVLSSLAELSLTDVANGDLPAALKHLPGPLKVLSLLLRDACLVDAVGDVLCAFESNYASVARLQVLRLADPARVGLGAQEWDERVSGLVAEAEGRGIRVERVGPEGRLLVG